MGWTKRQLVSEAYSELGLQGYESDITPDEQQTALRRLDTMLATWEAKGIAIGYAFPASPDESDLDDDSGIPDAATETVYLNLSKRIAPGLGKQLSPTTSKNTREGYDALLLAAAMPRQQTQPSTMPRGAGNRGCGERRPFFPAPCNDPMQVSDGDLNISQE